MRRTAAALVAIAGLLMTPTEAVATSGAIVLASVSESMIKGNSNSFQPSLSADGTKVAFASSATTLDPADTDSVPDIYVKDLITGDVTLASTSDQGIKTDQISQMPSLSADGTEVAFQTWASLDPADTGNSSDVYVKDLVTGDVTLATTSDTGVHADAASGAPSLSGDGSKVAFISAASNLDPADTDSVFDVYVKNLSTGDITLASTSAEGVNDVHFESVEPFLSADGTTVAFSTGARLDPADTDDRGDIYVKDLLTGNLALASTSDDGTLDGVNAAEPSMSGDGTRVAFSTFTSEPEAELFFDIYMKDLLTGSVIVVSASDAGITGNAESVSPSMSLDGSAVAFTSQSTNLDSADTDSTNDVLVKDLDTGDIEIASITPGGAKGNGGSLAPSLSADGGAVAFVSTATNLDPADTDSTPDVFVKDMSGQLPSADVGVRIADDPDPAVRGTTVSYTMTIADQGPDPATGVALTVMLPSGSAFVSVSASQGSCTVSLKQGTVRCALGSILPGDSTSVRLRVTPRKSGMLTVSASVTAMEPDTDASNNSDVERTRVLTA